MFKKMVLLTLLLIMHIAARAETFDRDYRETINGTRLHFRVRGADARHPYLLLLHGGPGFSAHMFYPWGQSLEKHVNVVYLDQRGSGESARIKVKNLMQPAADEVKDFTIPELLKDIEGVREFLKVKRWFVLGHSWGGMLGLEYVAAFPRHVSGFLFVDGLLSQPHAQEAILDFAEKRIAADETSPDTSLLERAKRLKPYIPYARKLKAGPERYFSCMQFASALIADMYYADAKVGTTYNMQVRDAMTAYHLPMDSLVLASEPVAALILTEHYATRDDTPLLARIKVRTLVINGKQDGLITPQSAEIVQRGIPGAKILLLDQCGHFPFAEQPQAFTRAVLQFVCGSVR